MKMAFLKQCYLVVSFRGFESVGNILSVTFEMKAAQHYLYMFLLIILYKAFLTLSL